MYYVIEITNYQYSSSSHYLTFKNESLNEVMKYRSLKTKLNKIENGDTKVEYVIVSPVEKNIIKEVA